ncbi:hypothetical protein BJ973_009740 [Actinoplanes tereljensis]|nr:hypothetical protein [Actinoplanes tereljensis]
MLPTSATKDAMVMGASIRQPSRYPKYTAMMGSAADRDSPTSSMTH